MRRDPEAQEPTLGGPMLTIRALKLTVSLLIRPFMLEGCRREGWPLDGGPLSGSLAAQPTVPICSSQATHQDRSRIPAASPLPALARRESSTCSTGRRCPLSGVDGQASSFAFAKPLPSRILVHHPPSASGSNAVARSVCRAQFRQSGSTAVPRFQFSRCLCRQLPERLR